MSIKRKLKRTIVVLKSPFHYKLPKHHIQYMYYRITVTVKVKQIYKFLTKQLFQQYFIQNKPHRLQTKQVFNLNLRKIFFL